MGVGSRRDVKKTIAAGAVSVNGVVVKAPEAEACENDVVCVSGRRIVYKKFVYLMMNKPAGIISASEGNSRETCCADLVGEDFGFYEPSPAGRLDKDSEGFLILTNDGDFIHSIISPGRVVDKEYYIKTESKLSDADAERFREGIVLGDGTLCRPGKLEIVGDGREAVVTIHEGKFHQVKRMVAALGNKVLYLKRISIGGVALDEKLGAGEYRELTADEMEVLKK